jgi:hypothetical protein
VVEAAVVEGDVLDGGSAEGDTEGGAVVDELVRPGALAADVDRSGVDWSVAELRGALAAGVEDPAGADGPAGADVDKLGPRRNTATATATTASNAEIVILRMTSFGWPPGQLAYLRSRPGVNRVAAASEFGLLSPGNYQTPVVVRLVILLIGCTEPI